MSELKKRYPRSVDCEDGSVDLELLADQSRAETEVALETMVAVRDRVISAYEEIMRMPI